MANPITDLANTWSRRSFLQHCAALLTMWGQPSSAILTAEGPSFQNRAENTSSPARPDGRTSAIPAFEEILPSQSGITWIHTNGRSPMAHLPETVGAGCAFLDYDNDGWMDIYLVNSGPSDFYDP